MPIVAKRLRLTHLRSGIVPVRIGKGLMNAAEKASHVTLKPSLPLLALVTSFFVAWGLLQEFGLLLWAIFVVLVRVVVYDNQDKI